MVGSVRETARTVSHDMPERVSCAHTFFVYSLPKLTQRCVGAPPDRNYPCLVKAHQHCVSRNDTARTDMPCTFTYVLLLRHLAACTVTSVHSSVRWLFCRWTWFCGGDRRTTSRLLSSSTRPLPLAESREEWPPVRIVAFCLVTSTTAFILLASPG